MSAAHTAVQHLGFGAAQHERTKSCTPGVTALQGAAPPICTATALQGVLQNAPALSFLQQLCLSSGLTDAPPPYQSCFFSWRLLNSSTTQRFHSCHSRGRDLSRLPLQRPLRGGASFAVCRLRARLALGCSKRKRELLQPCLERSPALLSFPQPSCTLKYIWPAKLRCSFLSSQQSHKANPAYQQSDQRNKETAQLHQTTQDKGSNHTAIPEKAILF